MAPRLFKKDPLEGEALKEKTDEFISALDQLEKLYAGYGKDYLTGDNFTLADLSIFTTLSTVFENGLHTFEGRDNLKAWYERAKEQKGSVEILEKIAEGFAAQFAK